MSKIRQHEALRVPQGWNGQDKAFVIQLERVLTDLYRLNGILDETMVTAVSYDTTTHQLTVTINGIGTDIAKLASLDENGKIPAAQLPSYVDDVEEYADFAHFPATGEADKIYVAKDTGFTYRWSGTQYVRLNTYDEATQSASGLMSAADKTKLDGIVGTELAATKLFLIGETAQAANPATGSNEKVYIGTDNCLYSNGSKVLDYAHLYNGLDYNTVGQKALDACNGYILSQTINAIRRGLLKVAVKRGSDWKLPSGTDAAVGDFLSVNGTLGKATAAITAEVTVLVKNTNWEEVPGGILNLLQANKSEKTDTVSSVDYDNANKKITKTINGTTNDVVAVSAIKADLGAFTWGQLANQS